MRNFTVKKSGHNWLVTDQVTGFSEFILSNETKGTLTRSLMRRF